jgi:hypothetical protein
MSYKLLNFSHAGFAYDGVVNKEESCHPFLPLTTAKWIKSLLEEIGQGLPGPIPLFCDNQGAIKVAYNPELHRKMKHIAIRYCYIKEAQANGVINTSYVSSQEKLADIFTKPLAATRFKYLREKMGLGNANVL